MIIVLLIVELRNNSEVLLQVRLLHSSDINSRLAVKLAE